MNTAHKKGPDRNSEDLFKGPNDDILTEAAYVLDERRRAALAEVDNAKFSWFHAKVCVVAGVGFFTDSYDIFAISIAATMLGYVYGKGGTLNKNQDLGIKVATPVGTLVGQLLFGWLADLVGRKRMYGVELMIIVVATFAQAVSGSSHAVDIIGALVVWRFIMGVGIGGDYPLSAVISSEFASTKIRGRMMTAVFANQGWGSFSAAFVSLITTVGYRNAILDQADFTHPLAVDFIWRLLIGLGCIPGVIALYFRLTIPETPRFTMDIEQNIEQASSDIQDLLSIGRQDKNLSSVAHRLGVYVQRLQAPKASWSDFRKHFGKSHNFKILLGTAYSWFALDIAFYGLGLNSGTILSAIGFGSIVSSGNQAVYDNLKNLAIGNLILSAAGLIPGFWASFLVIDKWGRKPIQTMGFIMLTLIFATMGFGYNRLTETEASKKAFVFLYCLANFFQNFGPNTTTFIIPGEIFPTRYRSTAHGISAASGKLGAIVAQVAVTQLKDVGGRDHFVKHLLEIFAFFMLTGVFSTLLLPETKNRSLEDLSNENRERYAGTSKTTRTDRKITQII